MHGWSCFWLVAGIIYARLRDRRQCTANCYCKDRTGGRSQSCPSAHWEDTAARQLELVGSAQYAVDGAPSSHTRSFVRLPSVGVEQLFTQMKVAFGRGSNSARPLSSRARRALSTDTPGSNSKSSKSPSLEKVLSPGSARTSSRLVPSSGTSEICTGCGCGASSRVGALDCVHAFLCSDRCASARFAATSGRTSHMCAWLGVPVRACAERRRFCDACGRRATCIFAYRVWDGSAMNLYSAARAVPPKGI